MWGGNGFKAERALQRRTPPKGGFLNPEEGDKSINTQSGEVWRKKEVKRKIEEGKRNEMKENVLRRRLLGCMDIQNSRAIFCASPQGPSAPGLQFPNGKQ